MSARNCPVEFSVEVEIEVADVNDQIAAGFDQIKVERSTTVSTGPFSEITSANAALPTRRLNLVTDETEYVFTDPTGSSEYWYRFLLYNSSTQTDDTASPAAPGAEDPALGIVSIQELKDYYLFGVDLTDDFGNPYPPAMYAHYIKSAVNSLEHILQIDIAPRSYVLERHAFYRDDYNKYISLETDNFPLIEVSEVRLVVPGSLSVQSFSRDWIHIQRESGQINIIPGSGSAGTLLLGASSAMLPLFGGSKFIPDVFQVSYRAGFGKPTPGATDLTPGARADGFPVSMRDPKYDTVPYKIKEVVAKMASLGPFNIAGDLLGGAGIASQSISMDGLSQSFNTTSSATNAGYGARIIQYQKDLKMEIPLLRSYYNGIKLRVV